MIRRLSWGHWSAVLIGIFFLYRLAFLLRGVYPPAVEEMQYWDWSRHLDWSYYSKPPLIACLIRASCLVFGETALGIRFGAVLLSLLGSIVGWLFVRRLTGSPRTAFFSALMINVMPLFAVGSIVMTTDTPLMFFWAVAVLALHLALLEDRRWAWWLFGVAFGLGLLSKYAMVYLLVCLAVFLLFSGEHRRVLRRPEMYLSLLLGFVLFLPVVVWNMQNDWVSLRHVAGNAALDEGFQLRPASFLAYIGEQALLSNPVVHVFMWFFAWRALRGEGRALAPEWKFLLSMSVPVYALLLLKSMHADVEGNWAAPAYFTGTIFAVARFEQLWMRRRGTPAIVKLRRVAIVAVVLPIVGVGLLMERPVFDVVHRLAEAGGISIRANMDPAYQFTGWRTLGRTVTAARAEMPDPERTFIFSWSYQVCAAVAFHGEGQPRTLGITIPERNQRLHQYTIWGGVDESKTGWDAISVNRGGGHQLDERVASQFERVEGPFRIEIHAKGKQYRRFTYYKCHNFSGSIPAAVNLDAPGPPGGLRF